MSKKILILSSSYRKGGNSEQLAAAFARGAEEAGHEVETIYLRDKEIGFCRGYEEKFSSKGNPICKLIASR